MKILLALLVTLSSISTFAACNQYGETDGLRLYSGWCKISYGSSSLQKLNPQKAYGGDEIRTLEECEAALERIVMSKNISWAKLKFKDPKTCEVEKKQVEK